MIQVTQLNSHISISFQNSSKVFVTDFHPIKIRNGIYFSFLIHENCIQQIYLSFVQLLKYLMYTINRTSNHGYKYTSILKLSKTVQMASAYTNSTIDDVSILYLIINS
jgi:hypothetical protein